MTAPIDCLCAGIVVADHVCDPVDHLPRPGELVLTRRMELTIGGCASNVAVDLATLGRRASIVGLVGDDVFGRSVREALEGRGVDCRHLGTVAGCDTAGTLIVNCLGEDRRFIHSLGANARFTGREVTGELIRPARALYFGGYCLCDSMDPEALAAMFRTAREAGVPTLLDVVLAGSGDHWARLEPVLPFVDYFLPNDDEAFVITGERDAIRQAEAFRRAGARTAIVTCGPRGAVAIGPGERMRIGTHPVAFVDGTGSGDAFVAGFIHGLLAGRTLADCLRYGAAMGASCVTAMGATTGALAAAELDQWVESRPVDVASD